MPSQPRAGGEEGRDTHWSKYKFLALTYNLMLLNIFRDLPSFTLLAVSENADVTDRQKAHGNSAKSSGKVSENILVHGDVFCHH